MATELVPLGKLITDPTIRRDAFHLACVPCIAGHDLAPGRRVAIHAWRTEPDGSKTPIVGEPIEDKSEVGVVDVFLADTAITGQRVWVLLFPNTVTSMKHLWASPDFPPYYESPEVVARQELLKSIPGARRS